MKSSRWRIWRFESRRLSWLAYVSTQSDWVSLVIGLSAVSGIHDVNIYSVAMAIPLSFAQSL